MPRSATTSDVFNAIAEVQRREILEFLTSGEKSVNEIAASLNIRQPQVSKHLAVLKQVGLVAVRSVGQQRLYQLIPANLKPIHEWVQPFEQFWTENLERLDEYLKELQGETK